MPKLPSTKWKYPLSYKISRHQRYQVHAIAQRRMKCPWCKTTWTIRIEGISHGKQRSDRLIAIGIILYMFGLSYRYVEKFLPLLSCKGSKSSIERDVALAGQKAKAMHLSAPRMRVRVLGVDGTGARLVPSEFRIENVEFRNSQFRCLAHWRKSKCRRAWQLARQLKAEGLQFESEDMLKLIELLRQEPREPTLPESIEKLVRRYINCRRGTLWRVNQLLQHIEQTWQHVSSDEADRTNNATERIIGLDYKIRAKTMRGLKNDDKVLGHCYLSEYLRGSDGVCDLRKVV